MRVKKILNCQFKRSCFISFWSSYIFIFSNQAKLFLARTDLRSELESLFYEIHLLEKTDQSRSQDLTKLKDILLHCKDEVSLFSFRPHFHPYLPPFSPFFNLIYNAFYPLFILFLSSKVKFSNIGCPQKIVAPNFSQFLILYRGIMYDQFSISCHFLDL